MPSSVTLRLLSTSGQIAVCEDGRNSPIELALDQIASRQFVMREESIAIETDLLKAGREQSLPERRADGDRKSVGQGKSVSVRVDLGGRRSIKQKKNKKQ